MTLSVGHIVQYANYSILPIPSQEGFTARIRRMDGRDIHHQGTWLAAFSTPTYPDREAAIEQAKRLIDRGELD